MKEDENDDSDVALPALCPLSWADIQASLAKDRSSDGFTLTNIGKDILPTKPGFLPTMMVDATDGILAVAYNAWLPM
jgi:hypothetical protein